MSGTVEGKNVPLSLSVDDPSVAVAQGSRLVGLRAGRTRFTAYGSGSQAVGELEVVSLDQFTARLTELSGTLQQLRSRLAAADQERSRNTALLGEQRAHLQGAAATLEEIGRYLAAAALDGPSSDVSASGRAIQALLPVLSGHASGAAGIRPAAIDEVEQLTELIISITLSITAQVNTIGISVDANSSTQTASEANSQSIIQGLQQAAEAAAQGARAFADSVDAELANSTAGKVVAGVLAEAVGALAGPAATIAADNLLLNVAGEANNALRSLNQAQRTVNNANQAVSQSTQGSAGLGGQLGGLLQALSDELQTLGQALAATQAQLGATQ